MSIAIANAGGFWGDDETAPRRTLERADSLDYLTMDYLAEVTMTVLARQHEADPDRGYATDFPSVLEDVLAEAVARDVRILANAGGVNPAGCREAVLAVAREQGLDVTVATVSGDDFRDRLAEFDADRELRHAVTDEPLPADARVASANAYFGAFPVAAALDAGADVVITGRVVDAALVLGPLVHEFGWSRTGYDRLARGLMAGHVVECGAQATGGNYLGGWRETDFEHIGFPIAEVAADGSTVVTKPDGTGGQVTTGTVAEQLLYEVADPARYEAPDVIADFQQVDLAQTATDRVELTGIRGDAPTDRYKASLHYRDGWTTKGSIVYSSPDPVAKAERAFAYLERQLDERDIACDRFHTEVFGANALHGGTAEGDVEEVAARVAVVTETRADGRRFGRLLANLGLGGPPAVTMFSTGRPSPSPRFAYHPVLVPKAAFDPAVEVTGT